MRTKHLFFVAALAGISGIMWSFQQEKGNQKTASTAAKTAPPPTYTPSLSQASTAIQGMSFNLNGLVSISNQQGSPVAVWKVFFNLGDGRFWKGDWNQFQSKEFIYRTTSPHVAYAETTAN
ncbi:MAG TPA: hypothetical protein PK228_18115, partial [Saprospiraceae bacterium]|nr:hypothetical protein [Saprospiraceae bacterium]